MPAKKSIPLSFKLILVVMGLLVVAAGAGIYVLVNQEPIREISISFDVTDGLPAEIYSGETLLGTTPLSIDYDKLLTYSQTEFVTSPLPASLRSHSTSSDARWKWQLDIALAGADPKTGTPAVLHVHEKKGNGTFMAGIPLTAMRNGLELEPIGGGTHSSSRMGREVIEKQIQYLAP